MKTKKINEERIKEIQRKQGEHGGPGGRFGGIKEKPKDLKVTLKKLISYLSNNKGLIFLTLFMTALFTAISLSNNVFIQKMVDALGSFNEEDNLWKINPDISLFKNYFFSLLIAYILYCIFTYLANLFSAFLAVRMTKQLKDDLFNKIVILPISYTDKKKHGDLMSRMSNDIDNITNAVSSTLCSIISGIITIIGVGCIMIAYSPLLTLISLFTLLLSVLVTLLMSKFMRPLFLKTQTTLGLLNSQTEEIVSGSKTVIAYNHQKTAIEEFNEYSNELTKNNIKAQIWGGSMGPIMNFVGNVSHFLTCLFGAIFVIKGIGRPLLSSIGLVLTPGIVVYFINSAKQFTRPINEIASSYSSIITALAGAERVFEILEEKPESFEGKVNVDVDSLKGNISFEHVAFSYNPEKKVLKDFSVDVYSGHKIALVGATGSGKTTIVNLLLRFYDIDSGSIKIDGIDIKDISKKDLRSMISIVLQDAMLFEDSVENNIKYGKENASKEDFEKALRMAHCYNFVNRLENKEKTILSEGANNISQGQRQLITIARAILANPKILILDEATSSVDTRTEKKIQDALVNLMKDKTSIIIAHRLSTIQDADLIVVLDQGKVIEMGNHEELLKLNKVYASLYNTQYKGLNT